MAKPLPIEGHLETPPIEHEYIKALIAELEGGKKMCANCRHTGCWIFLGVLYLIAAAADGQTVCAPRASGSAPPVFDLRTLSMSTPEVQQMINETGSQITDHDLAAFVKGKNESGPRITCQGLYEFISTFHAPAASDDPTHGIEAHSGAFSVKPMVWIASVVAVVIISAVGLLGVAVVPLVNKSYYNNVIQFLVALAVGCLTGDAFLHLLPHAISGSHGHSHDEGGGEEAAEERIAVLKGLLGLGGIYFFFLAEKLVGTISEYRTEKAAEKEERERILKNPRRSSGGIRRLSTFRESISVNSSFRRGSRLPPTPEIGNIRRTSRAPSIIADDILTTGLTAKAMKTVDVLNAYIEEGEAEDEEEEQRSKTSSGPTLQVPGLKPMPEIKVISDSKGDMEDAHKPGHGHGHSHDPIADDSTITTKEITMGAHGHSHNLSTSMASVAWMVIMGDGLHNFTDGMAIGVAFADSIAGGISTTVAVFCHELPHELGDFAVLLKTGMGIKEALFFNVVSSILCLIGMLVGIGVGNVEAASAWIFAFTAGTFVYIALVDMLPELNSFQVKPGQSRIVQMIIQNAGLITGAGIMLIIAMFEEQLLHLVG
ncbi:Zinc transporter ZIP10 [Echinococcus granulosus]|uniref:Zinc transporter ZIP10 n=1 Tax=Echinococcus granulosus TaxID=6210 RepID=W6UD87_ECHGR|nr:Zinc transporter ZIP10 [Echinococcus granulosus]EUB58781.1 Zinc transporter ZIP10 [Echinococcus granulosus]